ncbi:hypothetical protein A5662_13495 [Mycobacteriaceae bacterium 1482268.1]|nr:hypothetical protein A5662_13495 [Mycobacteriaceae bacterium 1482268.1]
MIATLTVDDRKLVQAEVARMSRVGFQPDLDPRETSSRKTGRFYRMHRVPDSDIRLWYRLKSHSEPRTLYVVVVEKTAD